MSRPKMLVHDLVKMAEGSGADVVIVRGNVPVLLRDVWADEEVEDVTFELVGGRVVVFTIYCGQRRSQRVELREVLELLQDAEQMAFYGACFEEDKFKKGRRKVIDEKIREAIRETIGVINKESA